MSKFQFYCEYCQGLLDARIEWSGKTIICPLCQQQVVIPTAFPNHMTSQKPTCDSVQRKKCPTCHIEINASSNCCMNCGYSFKQPVLLHERQKGNSKSTKRKLSSSNELLEKPGDICDSHKGNKQTDNKVTSFTVTDLFEGIKIKNPSPRKYDFGTLDELIPKE